MAKSWSPHRLTVLRRIRVATVAVAVTLASCIAFGVSTRKAVALSVNGETTHVTTYATSIYALLEEQGIQVKTHDIVTSDSPDGLVDHATITVNSAYQTTISIDGQEVPFWTVADSAEQLIGFFEANNVDASRISVDINNIYNRLTGGIVINANGPVTVIADGKSSIVENGNLPAASILDAKGITLGKEDRVSVHKDGTTTILRVERVTHDQIEEHEPIAYQTRTIVDPTLQPGQTRVEQPGVEGERTTTYRVTYVDGHEENRTVLSQQITKTPIDAIVAIGPEPEPEPEPSPSASDNTSGDNGDNSNSNDTAEADGNGTDTGNTQSSTGENNTDDNNDGTSNTPDGDDQDNPSPQATPTPSQSATSAPEPSASPSATTKPTPTPTPTQTATPKPTPTTPAKPTPTPQPQPQPSDPDAQARAGSRLFRPSVSAAQAYAAGAAAQRGWTGKNWSDLVQLWNHESGWRWNAQNPTSPAYGIPQCYFPENMAAYGKYYRDDAAAQIDWGLAYIAGRADYGSPSKAWQLWQSRNPHWY
ncbi:G5 domain-containing protein [Bifidobacterium gallicum]|nr:G5 domain-containing protein [Bifidobacterium gallicum]KFI60128.1 lytic transglycosylase [Bifidobacterium gallicum DSM 20093 = LMG 11596]